jgi:NADPH-dependent glutamate synthase beta subunit-like oxidoreductase
MDHIRLELSPCRQSCPIGQNCQAYIQQIHRGESDRALATVLETNPLPGVLGRICHQPCQQACNRISIDEHPVSIRALKRFLVETVARPKPPLISSSRAASVGIIGSGPAGLMAAWELRRRGHRVTVYDKGTTPGGNLTRVIPEFRLPQKVAIADIEWIESWGVEFELGFEIGRDMDFGGFRGLHGAVLLASGRGQPARLNIEGEDALNICAALPFLENVKSGEKPALGASVIVIGGGNVAIDAALTAKRMGTPSVRLICLERADEMPAFAHHVAEAIEEGISIEYGWGPRAFTRNGNVASAINCQLCLCVYQDQCFAPTFDCSIEKNFAADNFIVAVGDEPDRDFLKSIGLISESKSIRIADPLTLETSIAGVFTAGELISGPSSVVDSMATGRCAAISIDRYLRGDDLRYGRTYAGPFITEFTGSAQDVYEAPQQQPPKVSPTDRWDMQEVELKFSTAQALEESRRCLSCGVPVGYNDSCWACLPCEVSCPEQALRVAVPYLNR